MLSMYTITRCLSRRGLRFRPAQECELYVRNDRTLFNFLSKLKMTEKQDSQQVKEKWMKIGNYNVFAWSLSGIETSIVVKSQDGFSCCFDLGHASRESVKCDTVFISHGHMDHIAAIPHHVKKRELTGCSRARYFVPEHLVKPLTDICMTFAEAGGNDWDPDIRGINPGERVDLSRGYYAVPFPTVHRVKSQGYILYKCKKVLKDEYKGLSGHEIGARVRAGEEINNIVETPEVAFTGDTTFQVFTDEIYTPNPDLLRVKLLIVEATYINDEDDGKNYVELARQWGHVHLSEIYKNAELFRNVDNILLIHFSDKYSVWYIRKKVYETVPDELRNKVHIAILAKENYL